MRDERERQRDLVRQMARASGTDYTGLARKAGISPSTLTRFMNADVKHLLSASTLNKLSEASGVRLFRTATSDDRHLLESIAQAVGARSDDAERLSARVRKWAPIIDRLPPDLEERAFHLVEGLALQAGTDQSPRPGESLIRRRKGK